MLPPDEVKKLICQGIDGAQVDVEDLTGTQDHYSVTVLAEAFRGKTLLVRQRMVYAALGDAMKGPIHALALKTDVPAAPSAADSQ